ncbi:MAG TPA: tRNA pseudouridine(13) synthase TruD [archaeon]|nr:tRNA pseudouridine(13) synthase TruD [archaeon]
MLSKTTSLKYPEELVERKTGIWWPPQGSSLSAVVKAKPEDFVVEEITPDGAVMGAERAVQRPSFEGLEKPRGCEHLHLKLVKYGWDSSLALKRLARALRVGPSRLGFAGTKDKRALTAQRVSVFEPSVQLLESFNEKDLWVYPIAWEKERVKLGDLKGNKFTVTLRKLEGGKKEVAAALEASLKDCETLGVPNFFGLQRFGSSRLNSHLVGEKVINGDLKGAVFEYLSGSLEGIESMEAREARVKIKAFLEENEYGKAIEACPTSLKHERAILGALSESYRDYGNALMRLPGKLLLLFVHAHQSYLFNQELSSMLKANGFDLKSLKGEKLELHSIKPKSFPFLSLNGAERDAVCLAGNARVLSVEADDAFAKRLKAVVEFSLPKGSYATMVLRKITGELSA